MSDCAFHSELEAYHDGELAAESFDRFQKHLAGCAACSAELERLREFSIQISAASVADITPGELAGIHAAVDREIDEQDASLPLLRTAGMLAALAASVLIICGIWWLDTRPASNGTLATGTPAALAPEWEQMATTLQARPSPGVAHDSFFSPHYAATLDFMLNNLLTTEHKPWAKRNSF